MRGALIVPGLRFRPLQLWDNKVIVLHGSSLPPVRVYRMEAALGDCFLHGGNGVNRSTQVAFFIPTSLNLLHLLKVSRALPLAAIIGKSEWSGDCLPLPASQFSGWRKSARSPDATPPPLRHARMHTHTHTRTYILPVDRLYCLSTVAVAAG